MIRLRLTPAGAAGRGEGHRMLSCYNGLKSELAQMRAQLRNDRACRNAFLVIMGAALLLLGLTVLRDLFRAEGVRMPADHMFSLTEDGALPEIFMYVVEFICAAACLYSFGKTGKKAFLFFALLFGFITFDDSFSYHERLGEVIEHSLQRYGLSKGAEDIGELVAWGIAGILFLPPLAWCLLRMQKDELGIYLVFALVFAGLVFFAVGMDLIHSVTKIVFDRNDHLVKLLRQALGRIEDGGELLMVSLAACTAVLYARRGSPQADPQV